MSIPMSHRPLAPLGLRRLIRFVVAGLAIIAAIVALALTLSASKAPDPVQAVPAPAAASAAPSAGPQAAPYNSPFEHGVPYLNPQVQRRTSRHSTVGEAAPKAQHYAPNIALRKDGLDRRAEP
jgi:hypothetical protein